MKPDELRNAQREYAKHLGQKLLSKMTDLDTYGNPHALETKREAIQLVREIMDI